MPKKYKIVLCLSIPVVFLIFYSFNVGKTKLTSKMKHSHVSKVKKSKVPLNLADNDNMVAAILIMPKSYLPALEQFSNSVMAKNITILRAQLESKDGQMTAVYKNNEERRGRTITPVDSVANKLTEAILEKKLEKEKLVLVTGFLYCLASIQRKTLLR
jgi:hypothetical protein